jgi:CCR4-NOT transcriptional complex subunit CAF120
MFEHAGLQEAYTGALIAGKGKALNNINVIMDRAKLPTADWARVRFGAGTPWRRCWCVITPPDEKEVQKLQKQANKKKSAYDRSRPPVLKGDIKFYDSKRTKKIRPIATIDDAYSAFAIYPQSKPLIDASTLVKVEGSITIHSDPPTTTEGFVFVMPEVHPAVTGFEMMLRWLFPVFDTFALYGRPGRLVPDTSDIRSLMFAMPKHRRYGYLEILDVSGLILEPGSAAWRESEWRKRMKELTGKRMTAIENGSRTNSRFSSRRSTRNSFGPSRSRIHFDDGASVRSSPSMNWGHGPTDSSGGIPRTDSAPQGMADFGPQKPIPHAHHRSISETQGLDRFQNQSPVSNYDGAYDAPPQPPPHTTPVATTGREPSNLRYAKELASTPERVSSEDEMAPRTTPVQELQDLQTTATPEPVAAPPAFAHAPGSLPTSKPYHSPELRRANSRMSNATLSQLAGAGGVAAALHSVSAQGSSEGQGHQGEGRYSGENQRGVLSDANTNEFPANDDRLNEGLVTASLNRFSFEQSPARDTNKSQNPNPHPPIPFTFPNHAELQELSGAGHSSDVPKVPGHMSNPSVESTTSTSSQISRLQTSQSITRKPLPTKPSSVETPNSAETPTSISSLAQPVIDQATFDMIGRDERHLTPLPETQIHRQNSGFSSIYDEESASTASPDYASTRRSIDTSESFDRPRAGVMRTVGTVELDNTDSIASGGAGSSIHIDFGPTFNYASDKVPTRNQSPGPVQSYGAQGHAPSPSGDGTRHATRPSSSGPSKSPNRNIMTPETTNYRNSLVDPRIVAWQPGMATSANITAAQPGISAEQFVQQRAVVATNTPLYAHNRQQSSTTLAINQNYGRSTPTPPLARNRLSDYMGQGQARNISAELLQRPSSRGATAALGHSSSGDIASTLSAREQEHLARVTGQPLINMAHNNRAQAAAGLVGAIEAREKDKAQMKKGINSQAVEQAIAQRQQQSVYQQQPDPMTVDYRTSQYGSMGQYPQQYPVRGQSQQQWVSPAANVYAQGGGWSAPSPGYVAPEQGRQSPSQFPPRNQSHQYFPPQQQGGQGRGVQGYRGQGF